MHRYSDEKSNKVIDQIKKLLALASSPNENEAKLAFQRAQELMLKHNIDSGAINDRERILDINLDSISEYYPPNFKPALAYHKWEPWILTSVMHIFGTWTLIHSLKGSVTSYNLHGFPTNIDIALYTFGVVVQQGQSEFRKGYLKHRSITYAEGYWAGFVKAFTDRYKDEIARSMNNLIYADIAAIVEAKNPKAFTTSIDSAIGYGYGEEIGGNVTIRPGVGGAGKVKGELE